jgi:hypothetical protein
VNEFGLQAELQHAEMRPEPSELDHSLKMTGMMIVLNSMVIVTDRGKVGLQIRRCLDNWWIE